MWNNSLYPQDTQTSLWQLYYYLEAVGITLTDHVVYRKYNWTSSYQNYGPKCMPWVCHLEQATTATSKTTSMTPSMIGVVSVGTFATIVFNYSWCTKDGKSAC